ncbi:MAG: hypothetical protein GY758_33680, partial [Fuerstiella sp.]|nr:hypothetical protein [Fuerstiella sp.]
MADRPVFHGDMNVYREKRAELDLLVREHLPATLDMLRRDTPRYLHGVLGGRKAFLVPLPAAKGELRQTFVERWIEYLEGTKRGSHPVFSLWHTLRDLSEEEFRKHAHQIVDAADCNPIIRAAVEESTLESMSAVADVYGRVLTTVHRRWVTVRAENGDATKLDDPAEEQLRQVLYGSESAFAMSPREALDAYLLDASEN